MTRAIHVGYGNIKEHRQPKEGKKRKLVTIPHPGGLLKHAVACCRGSVFPSSDLNWLWLFQQEVMMEYFISSQPPVFMKSLNGSILWLAFLRVFLMPWTYRLFMEKGRVWEAAVSNRFLNASRTSFANMKENLLLFIWAGTRNFTLFCK